MNILEHPIYKDIYDLCQEIEKLPASEQETKVVVMASNLEKPAAKLIEQVKILREALELILPLAKGYVALNEVESSKLYLEKAQEAIAAPIWNDQNDPRGEHHNTAKPNEPINDSRNQDWD